MIPRITLTARRSEPGAYINGIWREPGPGDPFTLHASVQPASQRDIDLLPEGRRTTGGFRLFTDDVLLMAAPGRNADIVEIYGRDYDVVAEAEWQNGVIPHRSYLVAQVPR